MKKAILSLLIVGTTQAFAQDAVNYNITLNTPKALNNISIRPNLMYVDVTTGKSAPPIAGNNFSRKIIEAQVDVGYGLDLIANSIFR